MLWAVWNSKKKEVAKVGDEKDTAPVATAPDDPYGDFKGHDSSEQFVVLHRDAGSRVFRPLFHTKNLRQTPAIADKGPMKGLPVWDNNAGAVDYINEHQAASAPGSEYRIKNRKGEIV